MHITIAILAHNESKLIARTITSLLAQSAFSHDTVSLPEVDWEILVIPNGCTDDTHQRAEQALQAETRSCRRTNVAYRVVSLQRGGKSHAWNKLVHEISEPQTDAFVFIDADIEFGHADTIVNCVQRLRTDKHAWCVVDLPLKDFHRSSRNTWLEKLSIRVSRSRLAEGAPGISGQFYVVNAPQLRKTWMPIDLSVEDGFLYAMIITDGFRCVPDFSRVVRAENASHYFEGLRRIPDIFKHEVRITIGTMLNAYLCWDVLLFITPRDGLGAGEVVRKLNAQDPDWYRRMMANQIATRGLWAIRPKQFWHRLPGWWALPPGQRLAKLPSTLAMSIFELGVFWYANRLLVSGRAVGYW